MGQQTACILLAGYSLCSIACGRYDSNSQVVGEQPVVASSGGALGEDDPSPKVVGSRAGEGGVCTDLLRASCLETRRHLRVLHSARTAGEPFP